MSPNAKTQYPSCAADHNVDPARTIGPPDEACGSNVTRSAQTDDRQSKTVSPGIPAWRWRDAIAEARVPVLTKLVCYEISRYLFASDVRKPYRVSVEKIIKNTALGNKAVAEHLANAEVAGLLTIKREPGPHGQRGITRYTARLADNVEIARNLSKSTTDERLERARERLRIFFPCQEYLANAPGVDPTCGRPDVHGTSWPTVRETLKAASQVPEEHADQVCEEHDKNPFHKQGPLHQKETSNQKETVRQGESAQARSPAPSEPGLFCDQEDPGRANAGDVRCHKSNTAVASKPKTAKLRETPFSDNAVLSEEGLAYALSKGLSEHKVKAQWESFAAWHKSKGLKFADWNARWQTWVLREAGFFARSCQKGHATQLRRCRLRRHRGLFRQSTGKHVSVSHVSCHLLPGKNATQHVCSAGHADGGRCARAHRRQRALPCSPNLYRRPSFQRQGDRGALSAVDAASRGISSPKPTKLRRA